MQKIVHVSKNNKKGMKVWGYWNFSVGRVQKRREGGRFICPASSVTEVQSKK